LELILHRPAKVPVFDPALARRLCALVRPRDRLAGRRVACRFCAQLHLHRLIALSGQPAEPVILVSNGIAFKTYSQ